MHPAPASGERTSGAGAAAPAYLAALLGRMQ